MYDAFQIGFLFGLPVLATTLENSAILFAKKTRIRNTYAIFILAEIIFLFEMILALALFLWFLGRSSQGSYGILAPAALATVEACVFGILCSGFIWCSVCKGFSFSKIKRTLLLIGAFFIAALLTNLIK